MSTEAINSTNSNNSTNPTNSSNSSNSTQTKNVVPLKIPQNQFSTMTNVNELHEFIKKNPNVLDAKSTPPTHITINKIYTDKNSANYENYENYEIDKNEIDHKDISKKKNKNKIIIKKNLKTVDLEDSEDSDGSKEDGFVSKHEIEIEELDEVNRFLKLDLNNEKVRVAQLEEQCKTLVQKNKQNETTISYIKDCLDFETNNSTLMFETKFNIENITEYNTKIIDSARKFFKLEREYNKIKQYTNIDEDIKKSYDQIITNKFIELKKSYDSMNNSLNNISNTMKYMKLIIFLMFFINIIMIIYNKM